MGSFVLLTGSTGRIGYRVLVRLLESGYQVRAAVRNQAGFDKIKTLKPTLPYIDQLTAIIVPDITISGAYDDAVKGVEYIIHVASPIAASVPDDADFETELINPAVRGTIGMLESAKRTTWIKRIVITGSVSSTIGICDIGSDLVLDESRRSAESEGPFTNSMTAYKSKKITKGTNLLIMGPLLGYPMGPYPGASVHLDDVALMHVHSLRQNIPGNQEFLASSEHPDGIEWARIFDIIEAKYPKECAEGVFKTTTERPLTGVMRVSSTKAEEAFGIKFKSFEEQVLSVVGHYLELLGIK